MKIKTIIGTIALAASTCFGATDAELKAMLDAKDYTGFVAKSTYAQLTNILTAADSTECIKVLAEDKQSLIYYRTIAICNANLIDKTDAINIYVSKQNSHAISVAAGLKNTDILIETWNTVLNMPNCNSEILYTYIWQKHDIKRNNFELFKKTADKLLADKSKNYTTFIYSSLYQHEYKWTPEQIQYGAECIKNITADTCTLLGWKYAKLFDTRILKSGFINKNNFYFENDWKLTKLHDKWLIYDLQLAEYKDKAFDTLAKSLTDPISTYKYFSLEVDKFEKNKEMTNRMWPVISKDIHLGLDAAKYLNDIDKVIDILSVAKEELTAEELNSVIPMINALDADYRKDDIVKALRNINARYTLKLYDDRETWEPVLSKVRALIDVRQM